MDSCGVDIFLFFLVLMLLSMFVLCLCLMIWNREGFMMHFFSFLTLYFYFCSIIIFFWKASNLFCSFDRSDISTSISFLLFVSLFFVEVIAVQSSCVRGEGDIVSCSSAGYWRPIMADVIIVIIYLLRIAIWDDSCGVIIVATSVRRNT